MTDSDPVDVDRLQRLLDELEQHWRRQRAPIADLLAPGIPADQAQARADQIGVRLPLEVLTWYGWHNGVTIAREHYPYQEGIGTWALLNLDQAIDEHRTQRQLAARVSASVDIEEWTPDYLWAPGWLPIARSMGAPILTVDCSGPPHQPAPILIVVWEDLEFRTPKLASLTDMVATIVLFLEQRFWWWDNDANQWRTEFARMPIELRRTALS